MFKSPLQSYKKKLTLQNFCGQNFRPQSYGSPAKPCVWKKKEKENFI